MLALIGMILIYAFYAQHLVEGVRHGDRRYPGLHLRAVDRPLRWLEPATRSTSSTREFQEEERRKKLPRPRPHT